MIVQLFFFRLFCFTTCRAYLLLRYLIVLFFDEGHLKVMLLLLWLPCCCNSSQGLRTRYLPTIYLPT